MKGIILAAGEGKRLRPVTNHIPKALSTVDGPTTILDIGIHNLRAIGVREVVIVTGYAADAIVRRQTDLEQRHDVSISFVYNDKAVIWNNAYSLWCARGDFAKGAFVLNGDTVHPVDVEWRMLSKRNAGVTIALDDAKALGEEEMKVYLDEDGNLVRINKSLDPKLADGEYIGVTFIEANAAASLADALETTWRRDTTLYYEDAFQEYANRGGVIKATSTAGLTWIEVDTLEDLERAREIACLY